VISFYAPPLQATGIDGPARINTYPNPVQHELVVEIENANQPAEIRLFNLVGHIQFWQEAGSVTKLDVSGLPSGTYYLRVSHGAETFVKRIIKS
jgi:hypothetical protein